MEFGYRKKLVNAIGDIYIYSSAFNPKGIFIEMNGNIFKVICLAVLLSY